MAKKKTAVPPICSYTARAKDLKILGHVEAATAKEALKKARKQFGADSVERRDAEVPAAPEVAAVKAAPAARKGTAKGKPPAAATSATSTEPAAKTPAAGPRKRDIALSEKADKKLSAIDAAARVLAEEGKALTCPEMIAQMAEKGYWTSPGGKTPQATLYSAILREVTTKGTQSRFSKVERGKFARTEA